MSLIDRIEKATESLVNFFEKSKRKEYRHYKTKSGKIAIRKQLVGSDKEDNKSIASYLKQLAQINDGQNNSFFNWQYRHSTPIGITSVKDIDSIKELVKDVKIEKKQCFKNAFNMTISNPEVKYVEGYISVKGQPPIQHAWNKIGDKHFDVTADIALNGKVKDIKYSSIIELNAFDLIDNTLENDKHSSQLLNQYSKSLHKSDDSLIFKDVMVEYLKTKKIYLDILVVNENGQILLLKRNAVSDFQPNTWWLPGGKIEQGEDSQVAALRELLEETTINKKEAKLIDVEETIDATIYTYCVEATFDDSVIIDPEEHFAFEWVDISSLDNYELLLNLASKIKMLYEKYMANKAYTTITKAFNMNLISEELFCEAFKKSKECNDFCGETNRNSISYLEDTNFDPKVEEDQLEAADKIVANQAKINVLKKDIERLESKKSTQQQRAKSTQEKEGKVKEVKEALDMVNSIDKEIQQYRNQIFALETEIKSINNGK